MVGTHLSATDYNIYSLRYEYDMPILPVKQLYFAQWILNTCFCFKSNRRENTCSCVKNECCCPRTVKSSNFNKYVYTARTSIKQERQGRLPVKLSCLSEHVRR